MFYILKFTFTDRIDGKTIQENRKCTRIVESKTPLDAWKDICSEMAEYYPILKDIKQIN